MTEPTTDSLHVKAEGAAVQALFQDGLTWVPFRPVPDATCRIDLTLRKLPDLGLVAGAVQGVRHEHMNNGGGTDDEFYKFYSLHINLRGLSIVNGRGREVELRDGEAMLFDYSVSRTITRPGFVDHRIVRLPRRSLSLLVPNIEDALLRPIPRGTGPLRLLASYIGNLIDDPLLRSADMRRLISGQLNDLVAVTLGATRDAANIAEGRGLRAARLRAIKTDIEAHLAECALSPSAVARRQGISESYIRKLFGSEGTSFSDFVLRQRLTLACRMLSNPRWCPRNIASIAMECGFGDLSYFNRMFKRQYGATPSEIRKEATRQA